MGDTDHDIYLRPIGWVRGGRIAPLDDAWDSVTATIALDAAQFGSEALAGLDAFSHIEVLYRFHRVPDDEVIASARHPRGRSDWPKVGIFAQRGKGRPNRLGVGICRLLKVEGLTLTVQSLDAIDGTPVLDIKPVMAEFLPRGDVRQPAWSHEIMREYW